MKRQHSQTVTKFNAPPKPSAVLPPDIDKNWDDGIEWDFTPFSLPPGWMNRQLKRVQRIGKEIAEDDKKFWEAELERATKLGLEIQRDLQLQIERDRRFDEFQQAVEEAQAFSQHDNLETQKYLEQIAAAVERRRCAEWTANAVRRLHELEKEMKASDIRYVQRERAEFLRRGVLKGRGPKTVTLGRTA